ncbi:MAG: SDR family oxidoreductase, partial [Bacteroidales bacterium]
NKDNYFLFLPNHKNALMNISILGCGWLGFPLAKYLMDEGYLVRGSSTKKDKLDMLGNHGIIPYKIELMPEYKGENDFLNSEILVINFPPPRNRNDIETYLKAQIDSLMKKLSHSPVHRVLFVSSTSVYPPLNREVYESDAQHPARDAGKALLLAEQILKENPQFETTIIRFGGLIGYGRNPARFLAGRKNLRNGDAPVNLIHRDDCVAIISRIIEKDKWGEVYNACTDAHPTRREFYTEAAKNAGLSLPDFNDSSELSFKLVNSDKLKSDLNYRFHYPDPMQCI